jgi:hypothetical protein
MKTFENLQAEVEKLGNESKAISNNVDLRASYSGIKTFDAELVMDRLNLLATMYENLSVKFNGYSKDNLNNSSKYWAEQADANYQAGKEIRKTMTYLIRVQKIDNKINNLQNN